MAVTLVRAFPVTIPAGTPAAVPLVTPTVFEPNIVERIDWRFPPGCNGVVGIQIGARSIPVIPTDRAQFLIESGDTRGIDIEDLHTTGDWSVIGYNTGAFPHTIIVTYRMRRNVREVSELFILSDASSMLSMGES